MYNVKLENQVRNIAKTLSQTMSQLGFASSCSTFISHNLQSLKRKFHSKDKDPSTLKRNIFKIVKK